MTGNLPEIDQKHLFWGQSFQKKIETNKRPPEWSKCPGARAFIEMNMVHVKEVFSDSNNILL